MVLAPHSDILTRILNISYLGAWSMCDCLSHRGKEMLKKLARFFPSSRPIALIWKHIIHSSNWHFSQADPPVWSQTPWHPWCWHSQLSGFSPPWWPSHTACTPRRTGQGRESEMITYVLHKWQVWNKPALGPTYQAGRHRFCARAGP